MRERGATFTAKALSNSESIDFSIHTGTIGMTALITPAISNDLRVNYSIQRLATRFTGDNFGGAVPVPDSLLFPSGFSSTDSTYLFSISGVG